MELKTTKTNAINISSHQIAWNYAYCKSGGVSFYLVHPLLSPHLYLFDGVHGRELAKSGLRGVDTGSGSGVKPLWSGDRLPGVGSGTRSGRVGSPGRGPSRVGFPGRGLVYKKTPVGKGVLPGSGGQGWSLSTPGRRAFLRIVSTTRTPIHNRTLSLQNRLCHFWPACPWALDRQSRVTDLDGVNHGWCRLLHHGP